MLTREEHLEFCKVCENRIFSGKEGIICKITNAKAIFESTCDDYSVDEKTINNINQRKNFNNRINDFTFGLEYIGVKNGVVAGLIVMGVGFAWVFLGILRGAIHAYSLVIIIVGLIATVIAAINAVRRKRRGPLAGETVKSDDLLDNNI